MNQNVYRRARGIGAVRVEAPRLVRRSLPVVVFFGIAFAIDMLTGQRYSSVWGSAAILASVVYLLPVIRPALVALGGYAAVWVGFNLVRAVAEDAGVAIAGAGAVARWERAVFGDELPSASLQAAWFDPAHVRAQDVLLSLVHGSFFVVPFVVAALLWWTRRELFQRYAVATAATFMFGLVGFLLLPTVPPWMSDPGEVTRVTHHVLEQTVGVSLAGSSGGGGFWFEPNDLAALPSVHVAATVLVCLASLRVGRLAGVLGALYALAMTIAVVYLGEHFVLDALLGWAVALAGWNVAGRIMPNQRESAS
ncbi:MAG TPA: phosphatase PAP2 family protein [Thermomicrobiales bacterium]|nr:phosphatase PAP2 family protein [Thermomicrobiales bacterium]